MRPALPHSRAISAIGLEHIWTRRFHTEVFQQWSCSFFHLTDSPATSCLHSLVLMSADQAGAKTLHRWIQSKASKKGLGIKYLLEISGGSVNIFCARSNTNKHRWYILRIHEDDHRFQFYAWKRRTALSEDCGNLNGGCYGCIWETIKFSGFGRVWRAQSPAIIK